MNDHAPTDREERLARRLAALPLPDGDLGLERALAAYRGSRAGRAARRRLLRSVAALLAGALAMSGGVAAAYAASLPRPVQRVAHRWLSHLGVPAPHRREIRVGNSHREHAVRPSAHAVDTTPLTAPLLMAAPQPVVFGGALDLVATATRPDARIVLLRWERGGWQARASAIAPPDRRVVFRVRPGEDSRYAVAEPAVGRRSRTVLVVVQPELAWTLRQSSTSWDVVVRVRGAAPGERVLLVDATANGRPVATARIDRTGGALLVFARPTPKAHYFLQIRATRSHGAASAALKPATRVARTR